MLSTNTNHLSQKLDFFGQKEQSSSELFRTKSRARGSNQRELAKLVMVVSQSLWQPADFFKMRLVPWGEKNTSSARIKLDGSKWLLRQISCACAPFSRFDSASMSWTLLQWKKLYSTRPVYCTPQPMFPLLRFQNLGSWLWLFRFHDGAWGVFSCAKGSQEPAKDQDSWAWCWHAFLAGGSFFRVEG